MQTISSVYRTSFARLAQEIDLFYNRKGKSLNTTLANESI